MRDGTAHQRPVPSAPLKPVQHLAVDRPMTKMRRPPNQGQVTERDSSSDQEGGAGGETYLEQQQEPIYLHIRLSDQSVPLCLLFLLRRTWRTMS